MTATQIPPAPQPPVARQNGPALTSLILGIVSLVANLFLIPTILGLIFGFIGLSRARELGRKGMAIIGLILSVVGAIVAIIVFSVVLAGIGGAAKAASDALESPAAIDNSGTTAGDDSSDDSADDSSASDDGTATFGQTFTYKDGLEVTVTKLKRFTPSEYAAAEKADHYVMFQITVKNGSDEAYDPTLFTDTLQDGDAEADDVFDSDRGLKGSPDTKLLPGRSVKWKVGYGVNSSDLVMEVDPGFEYESSIFTS